MQRLSWSIISWSVAVSGKLDAKNIVFISSIWAFTWLSLERDVHLHSHLSFIDRRTTIPENHGCPGGRGLLIASPEVSRTLWILRPLWRSVMLRTMYLLWLCFKVELSSASKPVGKCRLLASHGFIFIGTRSTVMWYGCTNVHVPMSKAVSVTWSPFCNETASFVDAAHSDDAIKICVTKSSWFSSRCVIKPHVGDDSVNLFVHVLCLCSWLICWRKLVNLY